MTSAACRHMQRYESESVWTRWSVQHLSAALLVLGCALSSPGCEPGVYPLPLPTAITVSPATVMLPQGGATRFAATMRNIADHTIEQDRVRWQLSGPGCHGADCGVLWPCGSAVIYRAPQSLPSPPSVTLTATAGDDDTIQFAAAISLLQVHTTAALEEVDVDHIAADHIEVTGVAAGAFDPAAWQRGCLNWQPDVRGPIVPLHRDGDARFFNIYAPSVIAEPSGYRLFFGGWNGSPTQNDRVYSTMTPDFQTFAEATALIDPGDFTHVNNVNVQGTADGQYHLLCTVFPDENRMNKPAYFSSADGMRWNGEPAPYQVQRSDLVDVAGYADYAAGDLNGANVLLRDAAGWVLYFNDLNRPQGVFRATGTSPLRFSYSGLALATARVVNDVKRFTVAGAPWYLMALHNDEDSAHYALSQDGVTFSSEQLLFGSRTDDERYIVSVGWVVRDGRLLGALYGAGPTESLDQNRIFARWLQRRVTLVDADGEHAGQGAIGPDLQQLQLPPSGAVDGTLVVYREDGATPLAVGTAHVRAGRRYRLVLRNP